VFRALGLEYLDRTDIVQVPPKDTAVQETEPVEMVEKKTKPVAKTETAPVAKTETAPVEQAENSVATVQEVLGDMMGDAPACNECGHITIRNGSCYKCLNCGNSLGCS
jgi:ribonucleoside-diphosphate reductase alpha chain